MYLHLPSMREICLPALQLWWAGDTAFKMPVDIAGVSMTGDIIDIPSTNATREMQDNNISPFPWRTTTFLGACIYVFCYLMKVVVSEHRRYNGQHGRDTFNIYLRYRFNNWYSWTPSAPGIVLCSLSWVLLLFGALLLCMLTDSPISESLWSAWIWIAAPDGGGSAEDPMARFVGVLVSCGGMLIFALLMSFISSTVEQFLQGLRQGKGVVVESNHMVIVGFSPILPILLGELCSAAESRGGGVFVLLTQMGKPELEDLLQEFGVNFRNSTVVVRSGQENCKDDLVKVAVESASKMVILSRPGLSREDADAWSLNVLVSLCHLKCLPHSVRVFQCELVRNQRLFKSLSNATIEVVTAGDFVGSLMVQCSRQTGLAGVINSVFGFDGDEFYIHRVKGTNGLFFRDVLFAFEDVVACGLATSNGDLQLLPHMDTKLTGDESLILLAEDSSTLPDMVSVDRIKSSMELRSTVLESSGVKSQLGQAKARRETIVIIGFNESMGSVLTEIDKSVAPGSQVVMFSPQTEEKRVQFVKDAQVRREHPYKNFSMTFPTGALAARFHMESLPLLQASKVFFLADSSSSQSEVSAQTVAGILQVQAIINEGRKKEGIVSEPALIIPQILDNAAEHSCLHVGVRDYINSTQLAARLLAVVSESPHVSGIIDQIVADDGCDFVIRRLEEYAGFSSVDMPGTGGITFDEIVAAALLSDEIALGWSEVDGGCCGPWEMNPKDKTMRRPWSQDARVVALKRAQAREDVTCNVTSSKRWWSCHSSRVKIFS